MDSSNIKLGQICWTDLTVDNADELKEFYKNTLGWTEFAVSMKDENGEAYSDYTMMIDEATPLPVVSATKEVSIRTSPLNGSCMSRLKTQKIL